MSRILVAACSLAAVVLLTTHAQAQPRTGTLRLTVKDPSGAVVPGAVVRVRGTEPVTAATDVGDLVTGGQGVANVERLVPGRYAVDVSFPGFETLVMSEVRVRAGENAAGRGARDPEARRERLGRPRPRRRRLRSEQRPLQHGAVEGPDRRAAGRSRRDGAGAEGDGRARRDDPRGRLPRRQAAAEVADPVDPVLARHVRGREPRRRDDVRGPRDAAGPRSAAAAASTSCSATTRSTRAMRSCPRRVRSRRSSTRST